MKQWIINILLFIMLIGLGIYVCLDHNTSECSSNEYKSQSYIKLEQPEFLTQELSDSVLLEALVYYEINEPSIVLAQAKLESGNYKSKLCKEKNNIFGLYNSKIREYYSFNHWSDCILAYKNMIEYKQKDGENYYHFLVRIGYAEDSLYISKVKSIEKRLK